MDKFNYNIRDFNKNDEQELLRLYDEFGEYFVEIDDLGKTAKSDNYARYHFNQLIKDTTVPFGKILVVETDKDDLIGFAAGNIHRLTPETDPDSVPLTKGRVLELFVEEEYRGMGIGKRLMSKLEEFFKENSCEIINVEVFAPNQSAYQFYKKLGYVDRNYDLIKASES